MPRWCSSSHLSPCFPLEKAVTPSGISISSILFSVLLYLAPILCRSLPQEMQCVFLLQGAINSTELFYVTLLLIILKSLSGHSSFCLLGVAMVPIKVESGVRTPYSRLNHPEMDPLPFVTRDFIFSACLTSLWVQSLLTRGCQEYPS